MKTVIFTPTYNTTQEPQTEIEALSNCAVHPRNPKYEIILILNRAKVVVILAFLLPWELTPAKEVAMGIAEAFKFC